MTRQIRCPKFAIYYGNGKATKKHGKYTFQKYAFKKMIKERFFTKNVRSRVYEATTIRIF